MQNITLQGLHLPHQSDGNGRNSKLDRHPPLLATGVTSWRLQIQNGSRNYVSQYRTYFEGRPGCPFVSPNQSTIPGTAFTWRRRRADGRCASKDYPSGPSIYAMDEGLGLYRTLGWYRSTDSTSWSWLRPRSPTRPIAKTEWVTTWCANQQSRRNLVNRSREWAWSSGTDLRDGALSWRDFTGRIWWSVRSSTAANGTFSSAHTYIPPPWST